MSVSDTQWSANRPLFSGYITLIVLIGGFGAWSIFTTLSGAIIAPGQIEVSLNRQVVQHPDGGVVEEILVIEGERVEAGDVLLRMDGSALRSEHLIVGNQLLDLEARRARLEAQSNEAEKITFPNTLVAAATDNTDIAEILTGQASLFTKQAEAMVQARKQRQTRIKQIESQIEGIMAQQNAITTQIGLLEPDLVVQRDLLAKGLTQAIRVSELERDIAELTGRLGDLTSGQAEAAGRITEIEIEISALISQQREKAEVELRDVAALQLELQERESALAERISRLDVRAPASGLVLGLRVTTPKSVLRPADELMFIVPQDRPLLVAARVPVTHIDEVRVGQEVRLVFSSLPSRMTPEIVGRVTLVSADALQDERTGQTFFRAEIAIDPLAIQKLADVDIVPGMPVEAFIRTVDRTPLSYLLKPFVDYFRTAFRET